MPFYAVANGRNNGVYDSWSECENQVKGFSGASYKKFDTAAGAQDFVAGNGGGSGGSMPTTFRNTQSNYYSNFTPNTYKYDSAVMNDPSMSQWRNQPSGNFEMDNNGYVQVYTDGACSSNGRSGAKAGLGVYWGNNHPLNKSEPVSGRATNNRGEIQAATTAIKQALDKGVTKLTVNTDSQFLINSATKWMPGWKENGWKSASGEPVKNESDFKDLDDVQHKLQVKWNYVEAHKGILGNEMADQLAKAGASMDKK